MTRRELQQELRRMAEPMYGAHEASSLAEIVMERFCSLTRLDVACDPDAEATGAATALERMREVAAGRPVQYVTGRAWFCGLEFAVREGALIPRPETELLVGWVAEEMTLGAAALDIGTGSGAIAVALALRIPGSRVRAVDISPAALEIAAANAAANDAQVAFSQLDILSGADEVTAALGEGAYDAVVSNPPYIPDSERGDMHVNVTEHEPPGALFVPDDDPLLFYRAIARHAKRLLRPGGSLFFEIHERYGADVAAMLSREGYTDVELRRDINGRDRMARGRFRGDADKIT